MLGFSSSRPVQSAGATRDAVYTVRLTPVLRSEGWLVEEYLVQHVPFGPTRVFACAAHMGRRVRQGRLRCFFSVAKLDLTTTRPDQSANRFFFHFEGACERGGCLCLLSYARYALLCVCVCLFISRALRAGGVFGLISGVFVSEQNCCVGRWVTSLPGYPEP